MRKQPLRIKSLFCVLTHFEVVKHVEKNPVRVIRGICEVWYPRVERLCCNVGPLGDRAWWRQVSYRGSWPPHKRGCEECCVVWWVPPLSTNINYTFLWFWIVSRSTQKNLLLHWMFLQSLQRAISDGVLLICCKAHSPVAGYLNGPKLRAKD